MARSTSQISFAIYARVWAAIYTSAHLYSLIETAKLNGLEPYHYLRYVFRELPAGRTPQQIEALLPYNVDAADLIDPAADRKGGVG